MNPIRCAVALRCLIALWGVGLAGVVTAADTFTISTEVTTGLIPATHTVTMDNDADVQGYVLAIGWNNPDVEVTFFNATGAATAAGAELVVGEIFPGAMGMTLGVILDAIAPFDGQVIATGAGSEIATFDAQQVGGPSASDIVADFCFVDATFNDPPLSNLQVQAGLSVGVGEGLGLNCGTLTITVPPPVTFTIVNTALESSEFAGPGCGDVPILMSNSEPVQGYVLAIEIGAGVTGQSIAASGAAVAVGVEFEAPAILGGGSGATLGVVLDFLAPFGGQTIAPGADQEIAALNVCCDNVPDVVDEVVPLTFVDGVLDSPPLDNVAVIDGASINPLLENGLVVCQLVVINPTPADLTFFCGGPDGFLSPIEGTPGGDVEICFYYAAETNVQGFQLAVKVDCNLALGDFSVAGSIADAVGAEFVNWNVDSDPDDGDGCELVAGILLDALPPFDGQTVPPTTGGDPLLIGCIPATIADDDALCDTCLDVTFCNGINGAGNVAIENIMVINFTSAQNISFIDCCVEVLAIPTFKRGDCNNDDKCDLADGASILGQQFFGLEVDCRDACDANDDGKINLADSVFLLNYLFKLGEAPPAPNPDAGPDPTDDNLDCETAACA